jgi:hypothetical protein
VSNPLNAPFTIARFFRLPPSWMWNRLNRKELLPFPSWMSARLHLSQEARETRAEFGRFLSAPTAGKENQ